jgi:hypothetical protein
MLIAFGGLYKPSNFSASNLDFWYKYSITQSMEVMLQELELTPSMPLRRWDKEIGKLCWILKRVQAGNLVLCQFEKPLTLWKFQNPRTGGCNKIKEPPPQWCRQASFESCLPLKNQTKRSCNFHSGDMGGKGASLSKVHIYMNCWLQKIWWSIMSTIWLHCLQGLLRKWRFFWVLWKDLEPKKSTVGKAGWVGNLFPYKTSFLIFWNVSFIWDLWHFYVEKSFFARMNLKCVTSSSYGNPLCQSPYLNNWF